MVQLFQLTTSSLLVTFPPAIWFSPQQQTPAPPSPSRFKTTAAQQTRALIPIHPRTPSPLLSSPSLLPLMTVVIAIQRSRTLLRRHRWHHLCIEDGQTVSINISSSGGGTPINTSATVNSNSYSVTGLDLSSLNDGTLTITADVTDIAGNAATQATDTTSKDTASPTIAVAIDDGGDSNLNAAEHSSVAIAGTTSGVEDGQTVSINISSAGGGTPINTTATVNSNSYTVTGLDLSSLAMAPSPSPRMSLTEPVMPQRKPQIPHQNSTAPPFPLPLLTVVTASLMQKRNLRRRLWQHLWRRRRSNRFDQHLLLCWASHRHQRHRQQQRLFRHWPRSRLPTDGTLTVTAMSLTEPVMPQRKPQIPPAKTP